MFGLDLLVGTNISLQQIFEDKVSTFSSVPAQTSFCLVLRVSVICYIVILIFVIRYRQLLGTALKDINLNSLRLEL